MINKKLKYNKGEMELEVIVILFVVGLFILWIATGGPKKNEEVKPFIKPNLEN